MNKKIVLNFSANATEQEIEDITNIIKTKFPVKVGGKIIQASDIDIYIQLNISVPIAITFTFALLIPLLKEIVFSKKRKKNVSIRIKKEDKIIVMTKDLSIYQYKSSQTEYKNIDELYEEKKENIDK